MGRLIRGLLAFFLAVCTAIMIMKFLGVTWSDIDYFLTNGLRRALEILSLFKGIAH